MRTASATPALLAGLLFISACGGPSPSASAASPSPSKEALITSVNACQLVTATEASTAVGTTVTNVSASSGISIPGACVYVSADGASTVFVYAQTYPDANTADAVSADQVAAALNGQYGISDAKSVSGIGDKAFEYHGDELRQRRRRDLRFQGERGADDPDKSFHRLRQSRGYGPHGGQPALARRSSADCQSWSGRVTDPCDGRRPPPETPASLDRRDAYAAALVAWPTGPMTW